ncbi:hypothetical protein [Owenweeksia hongkongensis]|uniref:hypothetical protein n=1 Tax=Owenweeksia hongkongensis TaxID=253245 RepID=UPI003A8CA702
MKKLIIFLFTIISLSSCIKNRNDEPRFRLRSNSPVKFNEKLKVYVDSDDDFYYTIIHPDTRDYEDVYETSEARGSDGGKYLAYTYDNDGNLREDSILVKVSPMSVPCSNPVNKLTSDAFNFEMDFYSVRGSYGWSSYKASAISSQGDFYLTFGGYNYTPTQSRTYITDQESGFNTSDEVSLRINKNGLIYYGVPGELVHMEIDSVDNKAITLCDYKVTTGTSNNPTLINVRLEF